MEYRVNKFIDIQPLPDDKTLVLNKRNGQSYELGKKESIVVSLINGKRSAYEISEMCDFFSEEEIINLENQLFELDIISKDNRSLEFNLIKVKIPLFAPNKVFKEGIITNLGYYLFLTINGLFVVSGFFSTLLSVLHGVNEEKIKYIQSFSDLKRFEYIDILFIIAFFTVSLLLHEFGHLIFARKYDINVPDAGFMLYFFVPCAYTNLTFLNYCNDIKIKLKVFLAGTLSDVGLLGLGVTLFYIYAPDLFSKYFLLAVLVSMTSIIGNLVIAFKFDGYYILQTLLNIHNLKKYSIKVVATHIGILLSKFKNRDKKLNLKQDNEYDMNLELLFSVIYAVLSVIYIPVMIASGILMTIIQLGEGLL